MKYFNRLLLKPSSVEVEEMAAKDTKAKEKSAVRRTWRPTWGNTCRWGGLYRSYGGAWAPCRGRGAFGGSRTIPRGRKRGAIRSRSGDLATTGGQAKVDRSASIYIYIPPDRTCAPVPMSSCYMRFISSWSLVPNRISC